MEQRKLKPSLLRSIICVVLFFLINGLAQSPNIWLVPTASAQSATAILTGTVLDPQGAVVPNASITVTNVETSLRRQTTTDKAGYFIVSWLPPARYVVTVQLGGFATLDISDVVLSVNEQRALTIRLKVGEIAQSVTVEATSLIETESAAVSTVINQHFVENLPLNGRSFGSLIELTPGVVLTRSNGAEQGQFSINGQRANANYFMVDGVSATVGSVSNQGLAGTIPTASVLGGMNNLVSVDALQEFRVQTSTYAAEFGRMPGAQVSVITRSGTNQFHGSVFDYLRNDVLDANDWFANSRGLPKPALRQNDFGGVIGGPVFRNKTFFFFSYEGLRLRQPQVGITQSPTLATRRAVPVALKPFLDAFPIPNGKDFGNGFAESSSGYSNPSSLDASSIRIDHTLNSKLTLFGRFNYAPSETIQRTPTASLLNQLQTNQLLTTTLTLGLTQAISLSISHELRVNTSSNRGKQFNSLDDFAGGVPPPDAIMFPAFTNRDESLFNFGLGSVSYALGQDGVSSTQHQTNVLDNLLITTGRHQLKFGIDYRRLSPDWSALGKTGIALVAVYDDTNAVISNNPSFVNVEATANRFPLLTNFSAYGQDTWKVTPRLTFAYGLRWEVNTPPTDRRGNYAFTVIGLDNPATMTLAPFGTPLWKTTYGNFAPRIGVAYQLSQASGRETVLRGGFGIFYDVGTGPTGKAVVGVTVPYDRNQTFQSFPFDFTQISIPPIDFHPSPPYDTLFVFDPELKLPRTYEWNLAAERSIGPNQTMTVSYVGATGRRLLRTETLRGASLSNPNFTRVQVFKNAATSDYEALQLRFQRRLTRGFQALASYAWSHSIDIASADSALTISTIKVDPKTDRGSSDFDVRHSFSAAATYALPRVFGNHLANRLFRDWSIDGIFRARTATPVTVSVSRTLFGVNGVTRADLVSGVPLYVKDPTVAGGTRLNRSAFAVPPAGRQGSLGRNSLRGFPLTQLDFSLRRTFRLREQLNLQWRADLFNVFNHPNFGAPIVILGSSLFGLSTRMLASDLGAGGGSFSPLYQIGGPRSIQIDVRLQF
ncbi:MAG: carboxypeptidase regulatory-like domain-containing protein [Pyrinomonadaceae bacterium]